MQPKVSIILPVYNVEPYLRQCLDSVVNQTMREIQIICVNDGSPDNSLAILQEYANRDSRIEIIDKPNGGLSSARNVAYPHIKGKYTMFVDSDDWIDLDCCEKSYQKSEESSSQMTAFFYLVEGGPMTGMCARITPEDKVTVEEKLQMLDYPIAPGKLWRSDFVLGNNLYFPEGLVFEDNLVNWQAVTLADKISVVPEQLYHYRCVLNSISQTRGEHVMHIVPVYNKIREYLLESGHYAAYRDTFISQKLDIWHYRYHSLPESMKPKMWAMMRESLTADDREFYRTAPKALLSKTVRLFYEMIDGGTREAMNYYYHVQIRPIVKTSIRMPERFLRHWVIKPIKKRLKVA